MNAADDDSDGVSIGICIAYACDATLVRQAIDDHFQFCAMPLFNPEQGDNDDTVASAYTSTACLTHSEWSVYIVGRITPSINLDHHDSRQRRQHQLAFVREVNWGIHMSVPALLLPSPRRTDEQHQLYDNYARHISEVCASSPRLSLWVPLPLVYTAHDDDDDDDDDPWQCWQRIHATCEYSLLVGVALELTESLPNDECIERWLGEPVRAIIIPIPLFIINSSGYPVLSKRHQALVAQFFAQSVQLVLTGEPTHAKGIRPYQYYLRWLYTQHTTVATGNEAFANQYHDIMQTPLQPLTTNLQSITYATFEQDPVKYAQYEKAIKKALQTRFTSHECVVVVVAGAGRGPLVRATLSAAATTNTRVIVYAVEKNPNAVITLRALQRREWGGDDVVRVFEVDMRQWTAPTKAHILVTELLGSFGDNELSPECIDGVQSCLHTDGISIPCRSVSYLAPISSAKLWRTLANAGNNMLEMPYVVRMHNVYRIALAQRCFTFKHPNRTHDDDDDGSDNSRYVRLRFRAPVTCVVHGFAGYFDACLYDDIHISILPRMHTPEMISWFPIYFPVKAPLVVNAGDCIGVNIWRCVSQARVWYEWQVTSPSTQPIHNPHGRSSYISVI